LTKTPDFYLSTAGEYSPLAEPRACWSGIRLSNGFRDDYMEIAIEPNLIDQSFSLGNNAISRLVVASRLKGYNVYSRTQPPTPVYVLRILDYSIMHSGHFKQDQVEIIGWGMIFENREQAEAHFKRFG
jgi:hypothetical protein